MGSGRTHTRESIVALAERLSKERLCRNTASKKLQEHPELAGRNKAPIDVFKTVFNNERAAHCCIPNTSDVLSAGYSDEFISNLLHLERMGRSMSDWTKELWASDKFSRGEERLGTSSKRLGWEYHTTQSHDGGASSDGPKDYDFCWAHLRRFLKNKKEGDKSTNVDDGSCWNQAARFVRNAAKSTARAINAFSTADVLGMTQSSLRDTMFLISYKAQDNECRVPVMKSEHFSERNKTGSEIGMRCINDQQKDVIAIPSSDAAKQAKAIFPSGVVFSDLRRPAAIPRLSDEYIKNPDGTKQSKDANVLRNRLDALVQKPNALPACFVPTQFEAGVPLKIEQGVLLWNKPIGAAHSRLVVEMSAFLTSKPGIFGGHFDHLPASFRRFNDRVLRMSKTSEQDVIIDDELADIPEEPSEEPSDPVHRQFDAKDYENDDDDDEMGVDEWENEEEVAGMAVESHEPQPNVEDDAEACATPHTSR